MVDDDELTNPNVTVRKIKRKLNYSIRGHSRGNGKLQRDSGCTIDACHEGVPAFPTHPSQLPTADNHFQQLAVRALASETRAVNTTTAYKSKQQEYFEYCDYRYSHEASFVRYVLIADKVYDFMWYQSLREKRKRGGRRAAPETVKKQFDEGHYEVVRNHYKNLVVSRNQVYHPTKGISPDTFGVYRAALWNIHDNQVANNANSLSWEQIWHAKLKELARYVYSR